MPYVACWGICGGSRRILSNMKVVLAADGFKECLTASQVCEALRVGILRARPDVQVVSVPMADGGEGTVEVISKAWAAELRHIDVCDPLGKPVRAAYGLDVARRRAVVEMCAASGIELVPASQRDPTKTTTYGTGQLIGATLDAQADLILIGAGGSATVDGGCGAAQALGVCFIDRDGRTITEHMCGGVLRQIDRIDIGERHPRLSNVQLAVIADVTNPLCGPNGAAAIYGPQKGATPEQVALLEDGLEHLAAILQRDTGRDIHDLERAGSAGGLAGGEMAMCGADLVDGAAYVAEQVGLAEALAGADLVITGEGCFDEQSSMGKVVSCVRRLAAEQGVRCEVVAGTTRGTCPDFVRTLTALAGSEAQALTQARTLLATVAGRIVEG